MGLRNSIVDSVKPLLAIFACSALAGCGDQPIPAEEPGRTAKAPVLVLALDGFEWQVILPLVREGRMPNLQALMKRGTYGTLTTLKPTLSPRLWTSLATGKLPRKHGILGFVKPREGRGPKSLYTRMDRRAKAYWNILADADISTTTIGWWMTYPPERVPGMMVSQTNTITKGGGMWKGSLRADTPGQVWPPEQEAGVLEVFAGHEASMAKLTTEIFGGFDPPTLGEPARRWEQCQWAFRADNTYVSVLEKHLAQGVHSRVAAVYLGGTDVVGHRFWAAHEPEPFGLGPDSEEVRTFKHIIPSYYVWVDGVLGRLLALYPPDVTVFVVSDHGMSHVLPERKPGDDSEHSILTGGHEGDPGAFIAAGTGIRKGPAKPLDELDHTAMPELGSILDFCPTLLSLLGIPFGEDMDGRPLAGLLVETPSDPTSPMSITTHDDPAWLASQDREFDYADTERIEQLRNLGYLGDDDE
ncbi:MAG TPA: hypothetical protein EYQ74_12090 [Planctomycetes bacterium]|nr:hypothetical protein [Planctomycetota bacterium]HIK61721.1 hypothetical protein [Planctomycetota bacterium]